MRYKIHERLKGSKTWKFESIYSINKNCVWWPGEDVSRREPMFAMHAGWPLVAGLSETVRQNAGISKNEGDWKGFQREKGNQEMMG